jgi:hypothetical protein
VVQALTKVEYRTSDTGVEAAAETSAEGVITVCTVAKERSLAETRGILDTPFRSHFCSAMCGPRHTVQSWAEQYNRTSLRVPEAGDWQLQYRMGI